MVTRASQTCLHLHLPCFAYVCRGCCRTITVALHRFGCGMLRCVAEAATRWVLLFRGPSIPTQAFRIRALTRASTLFPRRAACSEQQRAVRLWAWRTFVIRCFARKMVSRILAFALLLASLCCVASQSDQGYCAKTTHRFVVCRFVPKLLHVPSHACAASCSMPPHHLVPSPTSSVTGLARLLGQAAL